MDARLCPICARPAGRHWTIPHNAMPKEEQARRLRWFSEEEAEAWPRPDVKGTPEGGRRR
jgi:hypothetical protein